MIGLVIGENRDPAEWDTVLQEDARSIIRGGLRKFFTPSPVDGFHSWRFMEKRFTLAASPAYATGTVGVTGGVVTLAGGTWPSWAADGMLRSGGYTMRVVTRTDDTGLVVENTAVTIDAGTTYSLDRWRFALPADFGELIGGVIYTHPDRNVAMRQAADNEIELRYNVNFQEGNTCVFAILPGTADDTDDWYMAFWPTMDENSVLAAIYRAVPLDNLDASDITASPSVIQVGAVHAETVLAAILAYAEEVYNGMPGINSQRYMELLQSSIAYDRRAIGRVDTIGQRDKPWSLDNNVTATYNGLI